MARSEWTLPKIHLTDFSDATAEDEVIFCFKLFKYKCNQKWVLVKGSI